MAKIKEIFTSIQGEGPYVGYKQLFIRFCGCNLYCKYCDTNFELTNAKEYSVKELTDVCNKHTDCHSVSLTGGEPLLNIDFLKQFLPNFALPVYLETNGTLADNLSEIIDYTDIISADIKLPSCTGLEPLWKEHENFFKIASQKECFAKLVFDKNINDIEIIKTCNICKKYNIELILQPMMTCNVPSVTSEFMLDILNKFLKQYKKVRLIPQVHKFINVI